MACLTSSEANGGVSLEVNGLRQGGVSLEASGCDSKK